MELTNAGHERAGPSEQAGSGVSRLQPSLPPLLLLPLPRESREESGAETPGREGRQGQREGGWHDVGRVADGPCGPGEGMGQAGMAGREAQDGPRGGQGKAGAPGQRPHGSLRLGLLARRSQAGRPLEALETEPSPCPPPGPRPRPRLLGGQQLAGLGPASPKPGLPWWPWTQPGPWPAFPSGQR